MSINPLSPLGTVAAKSPAASAAPAAGAPSRFNAVDPLRVARQYSTFLVITGVLAAVLAVLLWYVLLRLTPEYTTEARLGTSGGIENAYAAPEDRTWIGNQALELVSAFIRNQAYRIRSDAVISEALADEAISESNWFKSLGADKNERHKRAKGLLLERNKLQAEQMRGSTTILVSFSSPYADSDEMRRILDTVIRHYLTQLRLEANDAYVKLRTTFVQEQTNAEADIKRIQERLKQYIIEADLPNLQAELNEKTYTYRLLSQQMATSTMAQKLAEDSYRRMEEAAALGQTTVTPDQVDAISRHPAIFNREERLRMLRIERDVQLSRFGVGHPMVEKLDLEISATQREIASETRRLLELAQESSLSEAAKTARGFVDQIKSLDPKLAEARQAIQELTLKLREYERIAEEGRLALERRDRAVELLNQVRMRQERFDAQHVFLQQPAIEPKLTFPLWYYVIPGIFVALFGLAAAGVYLKEMLDQRVKLPADLQAIPGAELLGLLPRVNEDPSGQSRIEGVVRRDPRGLMAEAFRQVRTAMLSKMERRGYKTVLVVGAQPRAGVSSVTHNLASSLALNGRSVLVLDANLRRPAQHKLFGSAAGPGLVQVLRQQCSLDQALVRLEEPRVDLLPVGEAQDAAPEILEGQAFRQLLTELESRYQVILIDTPPALLTSDAQMLAKQADAAVLVVRAVAETRGMVNRMIRQVEGHRAEILGVVLNGARSAAGGYFRDSYDQFYRYSQAGKRSRGDAEAGRPLTRGQTGAGGRLAQAKPAAAPAARPDGNGNGSDDAPRPG